jgi:hypothetical protein
VRLSSIGGVRRVTYGQSVPFSLQGGPAVRLEVPGRETREVTGGSVGPNFLSTLGVRILAGRDLLPSDRQHVLVNASAARLLDPGSDVVGRMIRVDGRPVEVVGVFEDFGWSWHRDPVTPRVMALAPSRSMEVTFALDVAGDPKAHLARIRQELAAAEPGTTGSTLRTLRQHYEVSLFFERTATQLLYSVGLLALLLTAAGLHGIAAALFARRAKEFALRIALGASSAQVVGLVLRGSLVLAAAGAGLGLTIAMPLAQIASSKLEGISPWSLPAAGISSAIVAAVAVLAAAVPARRALRLQPSEILRAE